MIKSLLYFFYFAIIEIIKLGYFYRMGEYIMSVLLKGHEQIVNELNILYQVMVAEQLIEAKQLKEKIETCTEYKLVSTSHSISFTCQ